MAAMCSTALFPGRDEVYVAGVPLRGPPASQFLLSSTLNFMNLSSWNNFQHFMLIIKPHHDYHYSSSFEVSVYDFQPLDPENIFVAVTALSGRKVPGVILMRKLSKVPKHKCWFVGYSKQNNAIDAALQFNQKWDTDLRIGHHDCRNYCQGLVRYLTGHQDFVLEDLKDTIYNYNT